MFNVVPRMNCVIYWIVTYTRTKRKDRPVIFMLKFMRKKITIFYNQQLTISTNFDVPEHTKYSLFEDSEHSGYSLLESRSAQGTHITLSQFLECSGHSNKQCLERSMCSNKEYLVCSGTSNNNHFVDFQLPIVKKCDCFPQKIQHKNERPVHPLSSGISYKPIDNTVHPWHNNEHALWTL